MYQRYRERRRRRRDYSQNRRVRLPFRSPIAQITVLLIVALIIVIILTNSGR
jgi:hypothetical protein